MKLQDNFNYFKHQRHQLLKRYLNRFVVIKNKQILGDYDSQAEAYKETIQDNKPGTFLIHHCIPKDQEKITMFHSRMIFAE